jgi:hypothetical protein
MAVPRQTTDSSLLLEAKKLLGNLLKQARGNAARSVRWRTAFGAWDRLGFLPIAADCRYPMSTQKDEPLDEERIVASLALETHEPIDDVATLFERERAALAARAHVTKFLHIFAIRNVRETLRKRGADKLAMALAGAPAPRPARHQATLIV